MKTKPFQKENLRRGIYLLPNMFTSLNLFCGFYAVIASIDGKFVAAAIALIIVGLNGNTPLVIVGGSIFLLIFLRRFYASRK